MDISDFDYELPLDHIAQEPMRPREAANLMVVHKDTGIIEHKKVADFPSFLKSGDVLVVNNTKVFRARLSATVKRNNLLDRRAELFLVRPIGTNSWQCIGKPGKVFSPDARIEIARDFIGTVLEKHDDGTFIVRFPYTKEEVIQKANLSGAVPIPPYIKTIANPDEYQTAYAKVTGSVAAPTAGFHLTANLLHRIQQMGVTIVEITLHVGLGTFLPVKTDTVESHVMHSEWVEISDTSASTINEAKKEGRRVIAIGTTTTRALEGVRNQKSVVRGFSGEVNIFITPGFEFGVIDGLLTNFHLPKSTLILLVSAFAGKETIRRAYELAVEKNYRFYSFGDAMIII